MYKAYVTRCDLCHFKIAPPTVTVESDTFDQVDEISQESLNDSSITAETLKTIFSCFPCCSSAVNSNLKPSVNNFLKFCSTCKLLLKEWSELESAIFRLQLESRKLKSSLTSRILQGMSSSLTGGSNFADKRPKIESTAIDHIGKIQKQLWQEYTCHVNLNRMDHETSARRTRRKNVKTTIIHEPTLDPAEFEIENFKTETADNDDEYLGNDDDSVHVDIDVEPFYDAHQEDGSDYNCQSDSDDPTYEQEEGTAVAKFTDIDHHDDDAEEEELDIKTIPKIIPKTARQIRSRKSKISPQKKVGFEQTKVIPPAQEKLEIDGFQVFLSQGRFYCGDCGAERSLKTYMVDHIRKDHADPTKKSRNSAILNLGDGKYCRKQFEIQTITSQETDEDDDDVVETKQKYQCVTCSEIAPRLGMIVHHINQVHLKEIPPTIPAPRKSIASAIEIGPNLFELQGYQFTYDPTTLKYSCSHCKSSTVRRRDIHYHLRKVHIYPGAYKPKKRYVPKEQFMCDTCGKIFNMRAHLKVHVAGAHGDAKFDCADCGRSFKWNASLYVHRQTCPKSLVSKDQKQIEEVSCVCSYCGKSFLNGLKLRNHEKDMHQRTQFNCRKCQLTFGSKNELTRHWKRVHRVKKNLSKGKPTARSTKMSRKKQESEDDSTDESEEETQEVQEVEENQVPRGQFWGHFVQ